jgi:antitoxin CcdA
MRMGHVKKPVNLTIDAALVEDAKSCGVNLSAVLEKALRAEARQRWQRDNAEAMAAYNADVEKDGVWSDGWREW